MCVETSDSPKSILLTISFIDQHVHNTEGTEGSHFSPLKCFLSESKKAGSILLQSCLFLISVCLLSYLYR